MHSFVQNSKNRFLLLLLISFLFSFGACSSRERITSTEKSKKDAGSAGFFDKKSYPEPASNQPDSHTADQKNNSPSDQGKAPDNKVEDSQIPDPSRIPDPVVKDNAQPDPGQVPDPIVMDKGRPDQGHVPDPLAKDRPKPSTTNFRFIAMGDTGTGSSTQKKVALSIKKKCDAEAKNGRGPCDFGILLGDNFYDTGVKSAKDKQFTTKFKNIYHQLKFPWYITMGNHDYGVFTGTGIAVWKAKYYIDYSKTDKYFVFPKNYFEFKKQNTTFMSLNTPELFFGYQQAAQASWLKKTIAKAQGSVWKIAFGHHPYISNGAHGNAGNYDPIFKGVPNLVPFVNGHIIKGFFDKSICGKVDFYFSGHDHNRQLLKPRCGVNYVVSGAGAKSKSWGKGKKNPTFFKSDKVGFTFVHVKGRTLTIQFLNEDGKLEYTKTYTK